MTVRVLGCTVVLIVAKSCACWGTLIVRLAFMWPGSDDQWQVIHLYLTSSF